MFFFFRFPCTAPDIDGFPDSGASPHPIQDCSARKKGGNACPECLAGLSGHQPHTPPQIIPIGKPAASSHVVQGSHSVARSSNGFLRDKDLVRAQVISKGNVMAHPVCPPGGATLPGCLVRLDCGCFRKGIFEMILTFESVGFE